MEQLTIEPQKAVLVGVNVNHQPDFEYSMEELANLASACEVEVVGMVSQNLSRIHTSHYIGTGKLQEITIMLNQYEANLVIFNDELSPSQLRNLEADLNCKIVDRTLLILDIFGQRAKTREAQLQVEVAQLQYMLPRLVGLRKSLGRQSGGIGTKNRGAGETKLELDRRRIEEKIATRNKELEAIVAHRQIQRKKRRKTEIPVVSLVGYTNAGKSTVMNALVEKFTGTKDKFVLEQDILFATLETSVRNIELDDKKQFLLTDTVGFVSKLPHHLVKAFRSTLEEVKEADLLMHVVDFSNPEYGQHIRITNDTLQAIGVEGIPMIYAYNKIDLKDGTIPESQEHVMYISAKGKQGLDELIRAIRGKVFHNYVKCEMLIPYHEGQHVSYLNDCAHVLTTEYEEQGTKLVLECKQSDYQKFAQYVRQS